MTQPTTYRRSLSGSVGAGMKSVFGGEGRRYYMLVHKVSSKYHKAGEAQRIIVDQIEIGRDPKCQVRFDESFTTVSRRHAAIVKDGDNWKLVQLSQTNSTYLNGRRVEKEWYLQNGDEIQLSTNGPKLGFIVPDGEKGKVSSIGLTARLNLFRKQALRPYKNALAALGCLLVLCCFGGGIWIHKQGNEIKEYAILVAQGKKAIDDLIANNRKNQARMDSIQNLLGDARSQAARAERRAAAAEQALKNVQETVVSGYDLSSCHPYVFLIQEYAVSVNGEMYESGGFGTGFLLDDGKFVTAQHVVSDFYSNFYYVEDGNVGFSNPERMLSDPAYARIVANYIHLNAATMAGSDVVHYYRAVSPTMSFEFTSKDMVVGEEHHKVYTMQDDMVLSYDAVGEVLLWKAGWQLCQGPVDYTDYAYVQTNLQGGLKADRAASTELSQGTKLLILGHPSGRGEGKPILSEAMTSQNGLDVDGTIMASNNNTEGGNSGGPVFALTEDGPVVVGIVSGRTGDKGRFVPIAVIPEN